VQAKPARSPIAAGLADQENQFNSNHFALPEWRAPAWRQFRRPRCKARKRAKSVLRPAQNGADCLRISLRPIFTCLGNFLT